MHLTFYNILWSLVLAWLKPNIHQQKAPIFKIMWVEEDKVKGKSESFLRNYPYPLGDITHPSTVPLGYFTQVQVLSLQV